MSVVVISTVTFVLGTMPELTDNIDIMLFDNETEVRLHSITNQHFSKPAEITIMTRLGELVLS